jgi:hypothetical protein
MLKLGSTHRISTVSVSRIYYSYLKIDFYAVHVFATMTLQHMHSQPVVRGLRLLCDHCTELQDLPDECSRSWIK